MPKLTDYNTLDSFLKDRGIRFFRAKELIRGLDDGNTFPYRDLWPNIVPVLTVLDMLRAKFGPIKVNSGYRDIDYNANVGGVPSSYHVKFRAIDFTFIAEQRKKLDVAFEWLNNHFNSTWGIFWYFDKEFIHLDNRGEGVSKIV